MSSFYRRDLCRFFAFHTEPNKTMLVLGDDTASVIEACQPAQAVCLDLAQWNGQGPLPDEIAQRFPNGIDYLILVDSIGVWPDIQVAFHHLAPICNHDTRVIACYFNFLWAPILRAAVALGLGPRKKQLNWLSFADVSNLFRLSGYRILKTGYRCMLPVNLGPISWLANRFLSPIPLFGWTSAVQYVIARPWAEIKRAGLLVSVVVPARNEKGNIEPLFRRMAAVARACPERYELIFVEGHSKDDTLAEIRRVAADAAVAKPFDVSIFQQAGKGKGDAMRLGLSKAKGDFLLILDSDLTVPPEDLPKFVEAYCHGHGEFLNGSRLVYEMERAAMRVLNLFANKFFSWMFSWLLGQTLKDTLCGTKGLSRRNYERIAAGRAYFGDFDPFGDFDLIFGASKLDLEIVDVPVRYRDRTYGQTNISRWIHGMLLLRMCIYALGRIKFVP